MKNEKGFTMVELLGTIIILALLVTLAVVSVSGVLNSSYDTTYDKIGRASCRERV